MPLLEVTGLTVRFGPVKAVDGVDLVVEDATIVGLIGPNGAGKTTVIDALTGFVPARGGIRFAGTDVSTWPAHRRARSGLGRTWQSLELFDDLTVRDNLRVAGDSDGVDEAMAAVGIEALADRLPTDVSQGQRKLVSVARALAARPRMVCMDEPAAGLDTDESAALGARLRRLVDAGPAILLVDHDMGLVLDVCDRIAVVDFGRVIAEGPPSEVRRDPRVLDAYLGAATGADGDRPGRGAA